ncbi:nickel-binding protein [Maribacter sp. MAR_2009_72]|uniref:nickel-binding protein n=1 Tax=Maribacter sp. MAR_2009_72 TaxID=1250050 RepID=UPI00119BAB23|nr:nickel-binding protein [Maribacter sp. MAR_2009_72]TVZ14294.1 AraC-like DNA-binding protein [Maribacter sp. MAR_2009_72]
MPIYMDRHDVSQGVTAEDVADLHNQDLIVQHKYCCKGLSYWFDEDRSTAFCLVEAPNMDAIIEMHTNSHGDVPNTIIEVDTSIVESFLGRIEDPSKSQKTELNIVNNPGFRILAALKFMDGQYLTSPSKEVLEKIKNIIENYAGRLIDSHKEYLLISFTSTTNALHGILELKEYYVLTTKSTEQIRIGIGAGVPITKNHGFFEETIKTAKRLTDLQHSHIIITTEVKELYESENQNKRLNPDIFKILLFQEEEFLNDVMNYLDSEWQNPNLGVDDFCSHLGLSTSQLYRKTKSLLQTSTNYLIQRHRLNKAIKLLIKKDMNISEIAFETGFNSAAYFTKCFQKEYNILPSNYLKSV